MTMKNQNLKIANGGGYPYYPPVTQLVSATLLARIAVVGSPVDTSVDDYGYGDDIEI